MRSFFYKLVTKFKAPLSVRSWFTPSSESMAAASIKDPIVEFYKELGIGVNKKNKSRNLFVRFFCAAHNNVQAGWKEILVAMGIIPWSIFIVDLAHHDGKIFNLFSLLPLGLGALSFIVGCFLSVSWDDDTVLEIKKYKVFSFYTFSLQMACFWGLSYFYPTPFAWFPLQIFLSWYLIKGAVKMERLPEEKTPVTLEEFQDEVVKRLKETVAHHRKRTMTSDSTYAKKLAEREAAREEGRTLLRELQVLLKSDEKEKEYAEACIAKITEELDLVEQDIARIRDGKDTMLEKLHRLEEHLPRFEKIFNRRSLDIRIESFSKQSIGFKLDTEAFLESEIKTFRSDAALLIRALEQATLMGVQDGSLTEVEQAGEFIGQLKIS